MNIYFNLHNLFSGKCRGKLIALIYLGVAQLLVSAAEFENHEGNEKQRFTFTDSYRQRVSVQENIQFELKLRSHDEYSSFYQELFSIADRNEDKRYQYDLTATDLFSGHTLFKLATPEFDIVFVDSNQEVILLIQSLDYSDGVIWVMTFDGDILYYAAIKGREEREKLLTPLNSIGYLSQLKSESARLAKINASATSEVEVEEKEEEEDEKMITLSCGGIPYWLTRINAIEFGTNNEISGFIYQNDEEEYFFDLSLASENHTELQDAFKLEFSSESSFFCDDDLIIKDNLYGGYYSRWCEDRKGLRQGAIEVWTLTSRALNLEVSGKPSSDNALLYTLIGQGQYSNGQKIGKWELRSKDLEISDQCEFEKGVLHGKCISTDGDTEEVSQYKSGLVDGWVTYSYDNSIDEECHYRDGYKNGECISRDAGFIEESCTYDGPARTGVCTEYFQNSMQVKSVCEMLGSEYHGACTRFNRTGNVERVEYFQFDELIFKDI